MLCTYSWRDGWAGLRRTIGNRVYGEPYQGFESLSLRQKSAVILMELRRTFTYCCELSIPNFGGWDWNKRVYGIQPWWDSATLFTGRMDCIHGRFKGTGARLQKLPACFSVIRKRWTPWNHSGCRRWVHRYFGSGYSGISSISKAGYRNGTAQGGPWQIFSCQANTTGNRQHTTDGGFL